MVGILVSFLDGLLSGLLVSWRVYILSPFDILANLWEPSLIPTKDAFRFGEQRLGFGTSPHFFFKVGKKHQYERSPKKGRFTEFLEGFSWVKR